jgi:hypothetical protein
MTDNDAPLRPDRVIATVGGPVDELRVTLALYGDDLDPVEIGQLLHCEPTSSHCRGDTRVGKRSGRSFVYKQGAWFLCVEGRPPRTADEITNEILARVCSDYDVWSALALRFDIQMRYGVFIHAWNRGFGLSREVVERIGRIRASLEFDIYANIDDDGSDE